MVKTLDMVEEILKEALKNFNEIGKECKGVSQTTLRLISPMKSNKQDRISEQEIRFLFVRELEKQNIFCYSVEAPTKKKYAFTSVGQKSGNIDVCLYEKDHKQYKRVHLIEFKALNPKQQLYTKDFTKLFCDENNLTNYFIQILVRTNARTIPNIIKKYETAFGAISKPKSNVIIFIYDSKNQRLMKYKANALDKNCQQISNVLINNN